MPSLQADFADLPAGHPADNHEAFLARLAMEVAVLGHADEVRHLVGEQLKQHLGLVRVVFARADDDGTLWTEAWAERPSTNAGYLEVDPSCPVLMAWRRRETQILAQWDNTGPSSKPQQILQEGSGACVSVPLVRDVRLHAVFAIHAGEPRDWKPGVIALAERVAHFVWRILDQLNAVDMLRESEEQFRTMADNMPAICWLGGRNGVANWMNRAGIEFFHQVEGQAEAVVHPDDMAVVGPAWEKARRDEEPLEMTVRTKGADGVYRPLLSRAQPIRDASGAVVRWCGVQMDLSEERTRKRHEELLRALSEATRETSDANEILSLTAELLGQHLGVSGVAFTETDPRDRERYIVERDWTDGTSPGVIGASHLHTDHIRLTSRYRRGETVVVRDVLADTLFDPALAERLATLGLRACINVPLIVEGELVAVLLVELGSPRDWSTDEVKIVEDVADRTWAWLSRARAERTLRERERNQAVLLAWTDSLRHDRQPRSILARTMAMVGQELGVARANYAEAIGSEGDVLVVVDDWVDGLPSMIGQTFPLAALGAAVVAGHVAGAPFCTADTHQDPRFDPATLGLYDAVGARAFISVPLVKGGRLIAVLSVQDAKPRQWTNAEIQFLRELAERTWAVLEHARSEERLAESEALLAGFLENAPIGMYLKDSVGRFLRLNQEGAAILGTTVEEAVGRTPTDLLDPILAGQISALDTQALEHGPQSAELELPYRERLSSLLSVHFPVRLMDGETRVGGFTIDLTERKRAEAALARSREALFQSEKLTALGSLLAGVSHELNNPLSIVVAQSVMLERKAADTEIADRAHKIRKAADRCARIVQTFLAMARQKRPEREATDVNAVVSAALELAEYGLRLDGILVERQLTIDLPMIAADADQLHQILVNLVINAQQAMGEPNLMKRTLSLRTGRNADGWIVIDVVDTGPGVPDVVRRRIFEPFFTTKLQGQGTGIGLSFSQGLAEAHGGRLELVPSTVGAHFRLSIPVDTGIQPVAHAPEFASRPIAMRRALVVDDEPEISEALADFLNLEGFACEIADSGAQAKQKLRESDYDLIVSDLRMPGVDGAQLFAWLIAEKPELVERIAFATGDTLGADAAQFLSEARRPVLEKPFMPAGIARLLQQMALA